MRMSKQQIASNRKKKAQENKEASNVKLTPRAREQFLKVLRATGNVTEAADAVSITRAGAYKHYNHNPEFAEQWDNAIESACDALETEARRRAVDGVAEPVLYQGAVVKHAGKELVIRKYSDHLLESLLKAHRPEKYRERFDVNVKGSMTLEQAVTAAQIPPAKDKDSGSKS